ncbi:MAG: RNA-binding protein [Proteobacteria bacterium]|nr:RNA-binding protein [Pseudomonadota bacterium]
MGAAEEKDDRKAVSRQCALSRQVHPVSALLRFVAAPDGTVVPDIRNRLPGRGIWVTNSAAVLREAIKKKVFGRGLKDKVSVPTDLVEQVARLLRQDALQMLSLANKAGAVTTGFAKIEGMRPPVLALLQASDGSDAEISRLAGLMKTKGRGKAAPEQIRLFASDELALSLGRELVIHAALNTLDAAAVFVERARRLADFEMSGPGHPAKDGVSGPPVIDGSPIPKAAPSGSAPESAKPASLAVRDEI